MSSLSGTIRNFFRYKDLLRELVSRDIKLKYRRSFLGYLWSVLNPLMIMVIMTIVFSTMFRGNIENFPVYLFTGQLLFNFMNQSTQQAIYSITNNGALLKKIYLPKYIFVFSKITSGLIDLLFSFGALILVMLFTGTRFTYYCLLFPFVIIQIYIFCLGFGMFLAQANVFFRDIQYLYNAFITAWMYITPLFYPIEMLPGWLQFIVSHFNPMFFYIDQFRAIIYRGTLPSLYTVVIGVVTAAVVFAIGSLCFKKNQDKFILYI